MLRERQVVILVAGSGGLAAGHHLARNRITPVVLEKQGYEREYLEEKGSSSRKGTKDARN